MRLLSTVELTTVSGGKGRPTSAGTGLPPAPTADQLAAVHAALVARGISVSLDLTAGTATITGEQGTKTVQLPSKILAYLKANNITSV
jgi:hypothetical protein